MKTWMISVLSISVLAFTLTGCGEVEGKVSGVSEGSSIIENGSYMIDNGDITTTTITNEFGINPSLGTPPPLPAS